MGCGYDREHLMYMAKMLRSNKNQHTTKIEEEGEAFTKLDELHKSRLTEEGRKCMRWTISVTWWCDIMISFCGFYAL